MVPPAIRHRVPRQVRNEARKAQRLGVRTFVQYAMLERRARRRVRLEAGRPFDVGGEIPIVLDAASVPGAHAHWVEHGQMIQETEVFKRLARAHSAFLDIGAASGLFSALFCALTLEKAWAFEPSPELYATLTALVGCNPALEITPVNLGLGAQAGEQFVEVYADNQFRGGQAGSSTMVVETLDAYVQLHGLKPDFAKIDVEGMELDVLCGGADTFRHNIETVMLEVHLPMLTGGASAGEIEALLADFGFRISTLDGTPIADLTSYAEERWALFPGITNVVCSK